MQISNLKLKKHLLFICIVFFLFLTDGYAQDKSDKIEDVPQKEQTVFELENISFESEKLGQRLLELKEILKPNIKVLEVDSIINLAEIDILKERDSLYSQIEIFSKREIAVQKVKWNNYRTRLKDYQDILKSRSQDIHGVSKEITKEIKKWEATKEVLNVNKDSKDFDGGFNLVIKTLHETVEIAKKRSEHVFVIQKKLTKLILEIDETLSKINFVELELQKSIFNFDSKPIWNLYEKDTIEVDSLKTTIKIGAFNQIKNGLKKNKIEIEDFFVLNLKITVLQVLFILFFLVAMIIVRFKWNRKNISLISPIEKQTATIINQPYLVTMVIGVFFSVYFYDRLIPSLIEFFISIIFIGTIFLFPKLTHKSFKWFLVLVLIVYIGYIFENLLVHDGIGARWLIIMISVISIITFIFGKRIIANHAASFGSITKSFNIVIPLFIMLLLVAIVASAIGIVGLSRLLIKGVILATILGLVVALSVKIFTSIFMTVFRLRKPSNFLTLTNMVKISHQRIRPLLIFVGVVLWIIYALKAFELYDFVVLWMNELMHVKWEMGEMTISLGGILSFVGIFIIALILSKIAATIFQDEWMVGVLPRGVAPAISLMLRIILISIGLYSALSAAGLDLSKLGFMVGALGVGIGFGLQNVVLNFVAGLILAFERPINLGDTIEIDQELGVVTNIGVRSSNIKSYSGYEAIIPNGDLISKKVINYTLTNRDRRSKILMKTAASADPKTVIDLITKVASDHPNTEISPVPETYFYGYDDNGNLSFALLYWTTFSDTLKVDNEISLTIFSKLKEENIQAPAPVIRIIKEK